MGTVWKIIVGRVTIGIWATRDDALDYLKNFEYYVPGEVTPEYCTFHTTCEDWTYGEM